MTKLEGGRYQDENGQILPWYTSPCLEWLMTLDLENMRIWEYGTGDSTEWYRSKSYAVLGVDNDEHWASKTQAEHIYNPKNYPLSIYGKGFFDLVIIDGIERDRCTKHALECLNSGGYLIIDNYHQESVQPDWPETDKLIEGMEQTLYKEPGHWDGWATLVVRKP